MDNCLLKGNRSRVMSPKIPLQNRKAYCFAISASFFGGNIAPKFMSNATQSGIRPTQNWIYLETKSRKLQQTSVFCLFLLEILIAHCQTIKLSIAAGNRRETSFEACTAARRSPGSSIVWGWRSGARCWSLCWCGRPGELVEPAEPVELGAPGGSFVLSWCLFCPISR